ncbi:hypothetical protein LPJ61_002104 [Coemansia biformis]|uniref:Uncharacterized protein n=1 Tax=Coemansia biformis TaxID=1286918 RepID=A0A9W8CZZ2_9FUNG|nr:hypothetical protein LPJ61_002104 [Coemansia biformis]
MSKFDVYDCTTVADAIRHVERSYFGKFKLFYDKTCRDSLDGGPLVPANFDDLTPSERRRYKVNLDSGTMTLYLQDLSTVAAVPVAAC